MTRVLWWCTPQNTLVYTWIDCNLITVSSIVFPLAHGTILILRTRSVESQIKREENSYRTTNILIICINYLQVGAWRLAAWQQCTTPTWGTEQTSVGDYYDSTMLLIISTGRGTNRLNTSARMLSTPLMWSMKKLKCWMESIQLNTFLEPFWFMNIKLLWSVRSVNCTPPSRSSNFCRA